MLIGITALIVFNSFTHFGNLFIKALGVKFHTQDKSKLYTVLYFDIVTVRKPILGVGVIERFCVHKKDNAPEVGIVFLYIVFEYYIFVGAVGIKIKILQYIIKYSIPECIRTGFIHDRKACRKIFGKVNIFPYKSKAERTDSRYSRLAQSVSLTAQE